jgi:hypothetical protein
MGANYRLTNLLTRVAQAGDGLFIDQLYLAPRAWFGFEVADDYWRGFVNILTAELSKRGLLYVNTGEGRTDGADGQMFENWPLLPGAAGGFPGILYRVQPGDVLMLKASEPYIRGKELSDGNKLKVRALRGTAEYEGCHWGIASSPLKPDGKMWDTLRGHAPWKL